MEKNIFIGTFPGIYEELIEHGVDISEVVLAEKNICHKKKSFIGK